VVSDSPKRARKDAHDRARALTQWLHRLKTSPAPEQLLGTGGPHRSVRIVGDSHLEMDEEKITAADAWDGWRGVVTTLRGMGVVELFNHYRPLGQVDESVRITQHDLRARPVFHWTERRIRAPLALSFMATACVRHRADRVALQKDPMAPRRIHAALTNRQFSVLHDPDTKTYDAIPSLPSKEAKDI